MAKMEQQVLQMSLSAKPWVPAKVEEGVKLSLFGSALTAAATSAKNGKDRKDKERNDTAGIGMRAASWPVCWFGVAKQEGTYA